MDIQTDPNANGCMGGKWTRETDILQGVSRSFALTIPQLPKPLRECVTIAYLLCRIADTIEDEVTLSAMEKKVFFQEFTDLLDGTCPVGPFVDRLLPVLSESTLPAEKELVRQTGLLLDAFFTLSKQQRQILAQCVRIMSAGMLRFQEMQRPDGLPTLKDMNEYCYSVAGVVGEMLTELFCDYSETIRSKRDRLITLAPSFGQGLQMTNILKDLWEDRERGACWLPRDLFQKAGFDLRNMNPLVYSPAFKAALSELVGITHGHLKNALDYTLLITAQQSGIRKFCLWAIGMALLTLQNIFRVRHFTSGDQVKISRRSVYTVILVTNGCVRNDAMLRFFFRIASYGLPLQNQNPVSRISLWNQP